MTICISIILIIVVVIIGVANYNRDKERMGALLNQKGAALIRSFEAGTRSGMMGMMGSKNLPANRLHLQILLEETADLPDIDYISIVNQSGVIIAHNDQTLVGGRFIEKDIIEALLPSENPKWRIVRIPMDKSISKYIKPFYPYLNTPVIFIREVRIILSGKF